MSALNIQDMQLIARTRNGKCLSLLYENDSIMLKWMCRNGHTWEAAYSIIRQGGWCPQCYHKGNKYTLEDMQRMAVEKGGKCLSTEYINETSYLQWQCEKGHRWKAKGGYMQRIGSWCPHCAKKARLTIEQMHYLAEKKGGKCLSGVYRNSHSKLIWQCSKGHQWEAEPSKILGGQWCPHHDCRYQKVAEKLRGDIRELQLIAKNRCGMLLSEKYINRNEPLMWQCKYGHQWTANASNIKFGNTWCPVCAMNTKRRLWEDCNRIRAEAQEIKAFHES